MNLKEAMKTIDESWVRRLKGFRVHYQKREGHQWISTSFPEENAKPITSEVSAWELARRFAESTPLGTGEIHEGDIANIYVVDDQGNAVNFYGTNAPRILKACDTGTGNIPSSIQ